MTPYYFETRISYGDIDGGLKLTLPGAMRMMQEAAIIHSDQVGYSVRDIARTHVIWMLVQWRVRLTGAACWNEPVTVVTWPQTMEKLTSDRCFVIKNRAGDQVAVAESNWILVNADTGRVMRIPPEVSQAYELIPDGVFDTPTPKLPTETGEETYTCRVQRRDLDTNNHVNNLIYLDYAREALPDHACKDPYSEVIVRYHRQLLLGDPVHCRYLPVEQGHAVQICGEDPRHIHCTVMFLR